MSKRQNGKARDRQLQLKRVERLRKEKKRHDRVKRYSAYQHPNPLKQRTYAPRTSATPMLGSPFTLADFINKYGLLPNEQMNETTKMVLTSIDQLQINHVLANKSQEQNHVEISRMDAGDTHPDIENGEGGSTSDQ